ncbi:MAG: ribonuclease III domain-containing protein [Candidatus Sericytochromatia bacterium]|nr:ribonuclease III domain-containing protein [Candidatus Sericytochromatia bacterium]
MTNNWSQLSVRALAYVGDAVFELHVREQSLRAVAGQVDALHKATIARVSAPSQALVALQIEPFLETEEKSVFRRARNHKGIGTSSRASAQEYRLSTAFEAVLGYVYLKNDPTRLATLLSIADTLMENSTHAR